MATWVDDPEVKREVWELYRRGSPPPVSYDPQRYWRRVTADPGFAVLRLDPWRYDRFESLLGHVCRHAHQESGSLEADVHVLDPLALKDEVERGSVDRHLGDGISWRHRNSVATNPAIDPDVADGANYSGRWSGSCVYVTPVHSIPSNDSLS